MDSLDLDINNYDLNDILNLFQLNYNFTEDDLKKAKLITLKTHPDKSSLDVKFFLFFRKAYNLIYEIYKFRHKKFTSAQKIEYNDLKYEYEQDSESNKMLLNNVLSKKSQKEFNVWFNKIFEDFKVRDESSDGGYGDWFKSEDDIDDIKVSTKNDFNKQFNKKKNMARQHQLSIYNGVQDLNSSNNNYELSRTKPQKYSSDIFSKLSYEDLKVAHTETVVPVTNEDYTNHRKFDNVENLKTYRNRDTMKNPISLEQSKKLLRERDYNINKDNTERVFELLKKDEEMEEANRNIWANIRLLK